MNRILPVVALGLLLLTPASEAQQIPEQAKIHLVGYGEAFVLAVNDESPEERLRTVREIYADATIEAAGEERLVGLFDRLRGDYGELEYHHSEVTFRTLHIYARSRGAERWLDFQLRADPEPPHKILRLFFIADVAEPVYLPNGRIEGHETLEWLDGYIEKLIEENDLSASLLIARGDQPFFERSFGFADAAKTRPVTAETRFNLGSGNKMFTALAVVLLESEGKLSFDDPILKYFPDFPDQGFARSATIHHLLSHTSGLGDYRNDEYKRHWDGITRLIDVLPFVYADRVYFAPGSEFGYSNSGYLLAGLIVEKISGKDYFNFVREHLFEPLGMKDTDSYLRDGSTADLADPLSRAEGGWTTAAHGLRGTSAGGGFSTPRDMFDFTRGLISGRIIESDRLDLMLESKNSEMEAASAYGYGFILERSKTGMASFGHGGLASGINFGLRYFPKPDITFVIFSNQDNGAYDDLRKNIVKLITGDR